MYVEYKLDKTLINLVKPGEAGNESKKKPKKKKKK